ncbi:MAG: HNH endonuclease [Deltaproteobacteria bacterium]|nr:HNH endonuclease [Deltaproteobacteria bacterium]
MSGRWTSTHQLKLRLFREGLKQPCCELCGWCERAPDGRIPVELDHKNGDRNDNRLENLRVLCPNCHALQPTHRGLNRKSVRRVFSAQGGT